MYKKRLSSMGMSFTWFNDMYKYSTCDQIFGLYLGLKSKKNLKNLIKLRNMINYPAKGAGKPY